MITINDFFILLNYLRENRTDYPDDIDPRVVDRLIGVNKNAYTFFEETIDIPAFDKDKYKDMKNLRKFLIDWHSTHSSIIKEQLQLSDAYSMSESDLNELFYCFGFDIGESIKKLPYQNKLQFIYNLIDLYKVKGSPDGIFNVLRFFNVPAVDVCEYWLEKNQYGRLVFREKIVKTTNIKQKVFSRKIPFEPVVMSDPHWLYRNEENLLQLISENKIALPSKTSYYSIRPTIPMDSVMTPVTAFLQRLAYDHYYNPEEDVQNISLSNGIQCSYLELYCACVYAFKLYSGYHEFKSSSSTGKYLIYNATDMPIVFSEAVEPDYDLIVMNTRKYTLSELEFNRALFIERFNKIASDTIFPNENSAEEILNERNPELRDLIYSSLADDTIDECLNLLFMDLSTWIRDNVDDKNEIAQAWTSLILDFDVTFLKYLKEAIDFFKPLRARSIANEKLLVFDNPLEDGNVAEDHGIVTSEVTDYVYDFHTADSYPGILGTDTTGPDNYYSRNTFDTTSYFDIGASWDVLVSDSTSPATIITEYIHDYYNKHTSVESDYIQSGWGDLAPEGFPLASWSQGGFAKYDTGWTYDSPFNSDVVQVELVIHEYKTVSDPTEDEIDVPLNKVLTATFYYDVDETTVSGNVTLTDSESNPVSCSIEVVDAVISITPTSNLTSDTVYTMNFLPGLKSVEGYDLDKDYGIAFTTTAVPFMEYAMDPPEHTLDVPLDSSVEITFTKEYDPTTAIEDNIYIEYEVDPIPFVLTSSTPTESAIDVGMHDSIYLGFDADIDGTSMDGNIELLLDGTSVPCTLTLDSYTEREIVVLPNAKLEGSTEYTIRVKTGLRSNVWGYLSEEQNISFTTEVEDMELLSTSPADGTLGVQTATNQVITITFDYNVDPTTVSLSTTYGNYGTVWLCYDTTPISLSDPRWGGGGMTPEEYVVPATITSIIDNVITLTTTSPLLENTMYVIQANNYNPLRLRSTPEGYYLSRWGGTSYFFTTESAVTLFVSSDPEFAEAQVPLDKVVVFTFDRDIDPASVIATGGVNDTVIVLDGDREKVDIIATVVGNEIHIVPTSGLWVDDMYYEFSIMNRYDFGIRSVEGYRLMFGASSSWTTGNSYY